MVGMVSDRTKNALASLGLATLAFVWGTQFLVIKMGQATVPPLMTAALRFAVLTVAAQAVVLLSRSRAPLRERTRRLSFGVTLAMSFGLLYWAQSRIPSALAGVLSATTPLFVAMLAHRYVAGELVTWARAGALALGFAGVSIIVLGTQSAVGVAESIAVLAILLGEFASATNKVLAKQLTAVVPIPVLLRDMGLVVTVLIGLASFCFERGVPLRFTPGSIIAFAYLGLVASFAASALYLILLRRYTVTAMAYLQFATATIAAVTGVLIGGEQLGAPVAIGIITVLGGLLLLSKTSAEDISVLQRRPNPAELAISIDQNGKLQRHTDERQIELERAK
jgi:drug/metabolite transporter (DMT)-like permease